LAGRAGRARKARRPRSHPPVRPPPPDRPPRPPQPLRRIHPLRRSRRHHREPPRPHPAPARRPREAGARGQAQVRTTSKRCAGGEGWMARRRPKRDEEREERIANEIVVDAYNEQERALSWYCYLENQLQFPFTATCVVERESSPLTVGDEVEVVGMPRED